MVFYLVILMLICTSFLGVAPYVTRVGPNEQLFLFMMWLAMGAFFLFKRSGIDDLTKKKPYKPLLVFILGVVLSFIAARTFFRQPILTSVVSVRYYLGLLAFPLMVVIKPSKTGIRHALYLYSAIYMFVALYAAFINPNIIFFSRDDDISFISSDEYIHTVEGYQYIGLAFIMSLERLREKMDVDRIVVSVLLYVSIFIVQNRTLIFICSVIALWAILSIRNRRTKAIAVFMFGVMVIIGLAVTRHQWMSLFYETVSQVGDADSNRNLA